MNKRNYRIRNGNEHYFTHSPFRLCLSLQSTNYCLSQTLFIKLNLLYIYLLAKPDRLLQD